MSDPDRHLIGIPVENMIQPERDSLAGLADIELGLRVKSEDYGAGTVVAIMATGIQIHWDKALSGSAGTHLLVHDKSYVARLERL